MLVCFLIIGRFEEMPEDINASIEEWQQYCPDGTFACHTIQNKQNGIIRFNCADSLDRTNIATFCMSHVVVDNQLT